MLRLGVWLIAGSLLLPATCLAQKQTDVVVENPSSHKQVPASLRATANKAATAVKTAESQLQAQRSGFLAATTKLNAARAELADNQRQLKELVAKRQAAKQSLDKVRDGRQTVAKQVEKQSANLKQQQSDAAKQAVVVVLDGLKKQLAERTAATTKAEEALQQLQQQHDGLMTTQQSLQKRVSELETLLTKARTNVAEAEEAVKAARQEWIAAESAAEEHLIRAGLRVSFARSIAPIFHQRCVACHNARTARGRLNMESFAALMKGGESGAVVEVGDTDSSYLVHVIEDGSMPQDADPLSKEQISLIRRWIETGAALDVAATPEANLLSIMPKPEFPSAPEVYTATVPVTALAYSPTGEFLASSGYHEVLLWNAKSGELTRRLGNVAERVYDLDFSADGQLLAVASGSPGQLGDVKVFRLADSKIVGDYPVINDSAFAVAFRPDGQQLAACGADRRVRVWDVSTGRQLLQVEDHADWVMDVNWSADGKQLVTASRDKTAKVFNAVSGAAVATLTGHNEPVFAAAFLKGNQSVVTGGADKQLRVWNVKDGKQQKAVGGRGGSLLACLRTAENRVLSVGADRKVVWHQLPAGNVIRTFDGAADWLYSVAYHANRSEVAAGGYDGRIHVWDATNRQLKRTIIAAPGYIEKQTAAAK